MALKDQITGREYEKFAEVQGLHAVNVRVLSNFTPPAEADAVTATYPVATQEVYEFRTGGIAGAILRTVTVNYVDATKELILNVAIT